jgi:adenylate kinase family enzyme
MIIGFAGKMGAGKTTAAKKLLEWVGIEKGQMLSFADGLREVVSILTNKPAMELKKQEVKNEEYRNSGLTYGQILQKVGVQWREFNENIWVEKLEQKINKNKKYTFIDDVRFPNELEWIKKMGGKVYYIKNTGTKPEDKRDKNHISETALNEYKKNKKLIIIESNHKKEDLFLYEQLLYGLVTYWDKCIDLNDISEQVQKEMLKPLPFNLNI